MNKYLHLASYRNIALYKIVCKLMHCGFQQAKYVLDGGTEPQFPCSPSFFMKKCFTLITTNIKTQYTDNAITANIETIQRYN